MRISGSIPLFLQFVESIASFDYENNTFDILNSFKLTEQINPYLKTVNTVNGDTLLLYILILWQSIQLKYFKVQDKLRRYECENSNNLRCVIRVLYVAHFIINCFDKHLKTHFSCLRWRCDKYQEYRMSQLEGTGEQVDINYLCSNWISMSRFLVDLFLPTIRFV